MNKLFIGALVAAIAIAGLIVWLNVRPQDHASPISRACGTLKRWPGATRIRIDESAAACLPAFQTAATRWNDQAQEKMAHVSTASVSEWVEFAEAFMGGVPPEGRFLVISGSAPSLLAAPATIDDGSIKARTRIRWNESSCQIGYGVIYVEDCTSRLLPVIAAHEIGHALGVWHNSDIRSTMHFPLETDRPIDYRLTAGDIEVAKRGSL